VYSAYRNASILYAKTHTTGVLVVGDTSVRVSEETHQIFSKLAQQHHTSIRGYLARVAEDLRRQHILEETNRAYAALQTGGQATGSLQEERELWDATLADGLDE